MNPHFCKNIFKIAGFAALTLMASCPSEPTQGADNSAAPTVEEPSLIDEVDVMSPEEALEKATTEIDESNVLDELESLEGDAE